MPGIWEMASEPKLSRCAGSSTRRRGSRTCDIGLHGGGGESRFLCPHLSTVFSTVWHFVCEFRETNFYEISLETVLK